jgi:hypothetical protein
MQVVAPAALDGISQTYVIVNARGFTTSPQIVSVVATDPGLYPLPDGTSASPGGSLAMTAAGLGAADSAGNVTAVTAKLGDLDAVVTSARAERRRWRLSLVDRWSSRCVPLTWRNSITSPITVNVQ